jgi:predicted phage tail protein
MTIIGAGVGGGKGASGGSSRTPETAPDSLDSRQYANVIDLISEGEIEGLVDGYRSVFLNKTALQNADDSYNFEDVEIYIRNGTQAQDYIPLSPGVEDEKPVGLIVVKDVPVVRTITDVDVDAVRVTISIQSLQRIDKKNGDTEGTNVKLEIAIQYAGAGYTTVIQGDKGKISGRTADEYRKDFLIELVRPNPSDIVDIKVTRLTEDSDDSFMSNAFSWASYTEIIWAKLAYPNSALIGIRVDAEQFSSIPERSYLIKGIKVAIPDGVTIDSSTGRIIYPANYIWNGTFSAATWTCCPAWILWDLLTNKRYGFGDHIDATQLDKWAFFAASKYANELVDDGFGEQEARFSCNTVIQTAEEAYKLVNDLMSVMRCQGFWSSGGLTISQDRPEDPAYLFTSANVSPEGFSYSSSSLKTRPNVAVVSYLDLNLKDTAYEVVEDTESIDKYGVIRTEVSAFACTSRGQANRIGRWLLYSERYEKELVGFATSLEAGQQVRPGQIIMIADPVKAGSRRAGRISAATQTVITVDDNANTDLSIEGGSLLSVLLPDGTMETQEVLSVSGANITVISPFSAAPNANGVWMLEKPTLQASTWRVLGIQEQDGINYSITALAHNSSKYSYIENGEQLQVRDTTNLNEIPETPLDLAILEVAQVGGGTTKEVQYELNGKIAIKITFHWRGTQGIKKFRVKYRNEDDNFTTATVQGTTFDILDAKTGSYEIQVSSISASGVLYSAPALATYTVQGANDAPTDVTGLSLVPVSENIALLTWTQSPDLDVKLGGKVIIRHDPLTTAGAEWSSSTQIVDAVAGSSTQKQVPLLPGTYFLKFEDYLGNRSVNATSFSVNLPQLQSRLKLSLYVAQDYVVNYYYGGAQWEEENLATPFSGTAINCAYSSSDTALVFLGGEYVIDGYMDANYVIVTALEPYVASDYWEFVYALGDPYAEYYFAETLDLGNTYDVNFRRYIRITPVSYDTLMDGATGLFDDRSGFFDGTSIDSTNVILYIRSTNDDSTGSPTWGPWTELINCVIQGRAFQIKAVLSTNNESVGIAVDNLRVIPELLRRTTSSTSPITTASALFDSSFYDIQAVTITPIEITGTQYYTLSNITQSGFTANFFDGGTAIEEPYGYTATGYGRKI